MKTLSEYSQDFRSDLKSSEKTMAYFMKTLDFQADHSKKLAEDMREFVQQDMTKFAHEVKSSLGNVYRDFKSM